QFQVANLLDARLVLDEPDTLPAPRGDIAFDRVSLVDNDGIRLLDGVAFAVPLGSHIAFVGPSSGGKNVVPQLLARLYTPTSGRIVIGGLALGILPFSVSGRLIGYVGPTTPLFSASIRG